MVENAPWTLADQDRQGNQERIATILATAAEALRFAAVLLAPVLPAGASDFGSNWAAKAMSTDQRLDELKWGQLKPGTKVGKAEPIFPRLDKAVTLAKLEELAEADRNRDKPKEALKPVENRKRQNGSQTVLPESQTPGCAIRQLLAGGVPALKPGPSR